MKLEDIRNHQNLQKKKIIFEWWKNNGEDTKMTAEHFNLSRGWVYKVIRAVIEEEGYGENNSADSTVNQPDLQDG